MARKDLGSLLPGVKYGNKVFPNEMAGIVGQAQVGEILYVDANSGSDTANGGRSWDDAFTTLTKAEDVASSNNYDVIVVAPNGTSGTSETATLTWDKNHISVVGASAPAIISQRSRVLWTTDATDPCLTISGQGNSFSNVQLATFQASNDIFVNITNNRNFFGNVHFAGIGHETAGNDTTARCIDLVAAEENYFSGCTIGMDTIARSVANASIELRSASARNIFEDCFIPVFADNSGALFVKIASSSDIDRFVMFKNSMFHNAANSTATTMTVGMDLGASIGGTVILYNTYFFGCTNGADDFTAVQLAGSIQATNSTGALTITAA